MTFILKVPKDSDAFDLHFRNTYQRFYDEGARNFPAHPFHVHEISYTLVIVTCHISEIGLTFNLKTEGTFDWPQLDSSNLFFV